MSPAGKWKTVYTDPGIGDTALFREKILSKISPIYKKNEKAIDFVSAFG